MMKGDENPAVDAGGEGNVVTEDPAREAQVESAPLAPKKEPLRDRLKPARTVIPMGSDSSPIKTDNGGEPRHDHEQLASLLTPDIASQYHEQWVVLQQKFVDDPRRAVGEADELVRQVMRNLAENFSNERTALESRLAESQQASTEMLRVALRRYRSFFERLLSA